MISEFEQADFYDFDGFYQLLRQLLPRIKKSTKEELQELEKLLRPWLDRLMLDYDKVSISFLCLQALHGIRYRLSETFLDLNYNYRIEVEDYKSQVEFVSLISAQLAHNAAFGAQDIENNARYLIKLCSIGILESVRESALGVFKKLLTECEIKSSESIEVISSLMIQACESHYCPILVINSFSDLLCLFSRKNMIDDRKVYKRVYDMHSSYRAKYVILKKLLMSTKTIEPFDNDLLYDMNTLCKCGDLSPFVYKALEAYINKILKDKHTGYENEISNILLMLDITEFIEEGEVQNIFMYFIKPLFGRNPELRQYLNNEVVDLLARSASLDFRDFEEEKLNKLLYYGFGIIKISVATFLMENIQSVDRMERILKFINAQHDSDDASVQKFIYKSLLPDFITRLFSHEGRFDPVLFKLIENSLAKLNRCPVPKFDLTILQIITKKVVNSKYHNEKVDLYLSDILKRIHENSLMIAQTEYERTMSNEIVNILREHKSIPVYEQCEYDLVYRNLINAPSFSDADGYSNMLLLRLDNTQALCKDLKIQIQARHELFRDEIKDFLDYNILFESIVKHPVFPIAMALCKIIDKHPNIPLSQESLIELCKLALEDAKTFYTLFHESMQELDEYANEEINSAIGDSDHIFIISRLQRCFWRTIKHVAELYLAIVERNEDLKSKVELIEVVCDIMTSVRNWGAVKALNDVYKKALVRLDNKTVDGLLHNHIDYLNDEISSTTIERLDEKNAGVSQRFISIIHADKPRRIELTSRLMNALAKSISFSSENVRYNACSILCYVFKDATLSPIVSSLNWHTRIFDSVIDGLTSESIRIRYTCTNLFIFISKQDFMESDMWGLFEFYPNIERILFNKLQEFLEFKDYLPYTPCPAYVLLLILGNCKNTDHKYSENSTRGKWQGLLRVYLKHQDWHVRSMAANALFNCLPAEFNLNKYIDLLQESRCQNEIHGIVCVLKRIHESLSFPESTISRLKSILENKNLHNLNKKLMKELILKE